MNKAQTTPCPHQVVRCLGPTATAASPYYLVWCGLANAELGFAHAFPSTWCQQCSHDVGDPVVKKVIRTGADCRLRVGGKPNEKHASMSLDQAVTTLTEHGTPTSRLGDELVSLVADGVLTRDDALQLVARHHLDVDEGENRDA